MLFFLLKMLLLRIILIEEEFYVFKTFSILWIQYSVSQQERKCCVEKIFESREVWKTLMTNDVKGKSSKGKISNLYGVNASEEIELKILADNIRGMLQEIE